MQHASELYLLSNLRGAVALHLSMFVGFEILGFVSSHTHRLDISRHDLVGRVSCELNNFGGCHEERNRKNKAILFPILVAVVRNCDVIAGNCEGTGGSGCK